MSCASREDSLRRDDMAPPPRAPRRWAKVKRWQLMYTSAGDRKASRKLYPHAVARKLVARLNRRGCDAYASPLMITIEVT